MVFPYMATLQKLSNHLALLIPSNLDPSDKQQKDLDYLQTMVPERWKELYEHRDSLYNLSNPEFCGKVRLSSSEGCLKLIYIPVENPQELAIILA